MTNSWEEEEAAMEEEDEDHQDHYDPIHKPPPDEALPLILTKLSDPKSLLCCSLVSKHFASILSHSQSLSLQFPSNSYTIPAPTPLLPYRKPKPLTKFLLTPFRFLRQISTPKPRPSSELENIVVVDEDVLLLRLTKLILSRFTSNIRSLRVQLPCSPSCLWDYPPRRNFQFSWIFDDCKKLKTFAFLSVSSISKIDDQVGEKGSVFVDQRYGPLCWTGGSLVLYATLINRTLLLLVSRHPNIEIVEITDSKKHGVVSLQGEQLCNLKNNMSPNASEETVSMNFLQRCYVMWYATRLRLPRSGFVMEGVTLGVGLADRFLSKYHDIDGIVADFENNGDAIFGEALTQFCISRFPDGQAASVSIFRKKICASTIGHGGSSDMEA